MDEEVCGGRERMGTQRARGVGRLREEAERPGEAALQGLLTCRLHISELQSSLILPSWVSEALLSLTECAACIYVCVCVTVCAPMNACLHFGMCDCMCTCFAHVQICMQLCWKQQQMRSPDVKGCSASPSPSLPFSHCSKKHSSNCNTHLTETLR